MYLRIYGALYLCKAIFMYMLRLCIYVYTDLCTALYMYIHPCVNTDLCMDRTPLGQDPCVGYINKYGQDWQYRQDQKYVRTGPRARTGLYVWTGPSTDPGQDQDNLMKTFTIRVSMDRTNFL